MIRLASKDAVPFPGGPRVRIHFPPPASLSGPPRGKVNDAVSFLWRWELAGHLRDAEAWRMMHDFANSAFPRAGVAFSDIHIALTQAVAREDAALEERTRQMDELARQGRYPSGSV